MHCWRHWQRKLTTCLVRPSNFMALAMLKVVNICFSCNLSSMIILSCHCSISNLMILFANNRLFSWSTILHWMIVLYLLVLKRIFFLLYCQNLVALKGQHILQFLWSFGIIIVGKNVTICQNSESKVVLLCSRLWQNIELSGNKIYSYRDQQKITVQRWSFLSELVLIFSTE